MKKIVSIGRVKNEADIIESFVRYTLTYSDHLVVFDDDSSDNTVEILYKLKSEFENSITIIQRGKDELELGMDDVNNSLVNYAITHLSAEIIIPLDADEFLITPNNLPVRDVLEMLSPRECYACKWRTYVCSDIESNSSEFIPLRYRIYRNPERIAEMTKIIIQKDAWIQYNLSLILGNHNVFNHENSYSSINIDTLLFAHYPIRSKQHAISKIVKNHIKDSIDYQCVFGRDFHITNMYYQLKSNNFHIGDEEYVNFSLNYSSSTDSSLSSDLPLCLISNPFEIYPNIPIKYKIKEIDLFDTIFQGISSLATTYKSGDQGYYLSNMLSCIDDFGRKYCYQCYVKSSKNPTLISKIYFRFVQRFSSSIHNPGKKLYYILLSLPTLCGRFHRK